MKVQIKTSQSSKILETVIIEKKRVHISPYNTLRVNGILPPADIDLYYNGEL